MKSRSFVVVVCTTIVLATAISLSWLQSPPGSGSPTVLVLPYIQPGDGQRLEGRDVKVLLWLTDQIAADYYVELSGPGFPGCIVRPKRTSLDFLAKEGEKKIAVKGKKRDGAFPPPVEHDQHYFRYAAYLDDLPFDSEIHYRVMLGSSVIRQATFRTRATADKSARCVLVGDMAQGRPVQMAIAYQMHLKNPDFVVALGDIVYPTGRANQYMAYFWNTYNDVAFASPKNGAPLMATVPFYAVLGNHDVGDRLPKVPDALAAYYFFAPPKSGPGEGKWTTPLGKDESAKRFRERAADAYPYLDVYSFDYGPGHFVVFNNNDGISNDAPAFRQWLLNDLKTSTAPWKFVCAHAPGFQSSNAHYTEQQLRLLQPIFEEGGVNVVYAGHVHNYQRSVPFTFMPEGGRAKQGKVNGKFTLDASFDGVINTRPRGIIHIVAGGGGASLNGPNLDKKGIDSLFKTHGANYAEYTAKMVADKHTFATLDMSPERLELRAITADGLEVDHIVITK